MKSSSNVYVPVNTSFTAGIQPMVQSQQNMQPMNDYMYSVDYQFMWPQMSQSSYPWQMQMGMNQQFSMYPQYMQTHQDYSVFSPNDEKGKT